MQPSIMTARTASILTFPRGTGRNPGRGGVDIQGSVDLKPAVSTYDLNLGIRELNPSSLGTGLNIRETVTASAAVTGKLPEPIIIGQLYMKNLNLPGLKFTNVRGDFKYKDGYIGAQNVTADVLGAPVMPRAVLISIPRPMMSMSKVTTFIVKMPLGFPSSGPWSSWI